MMRKGIGMVGILGFMFLDKTKNGILDNSLECDLNEVVNRCSCFVSLCKVLVYVLVLFNLIRVCFIAW